MSYKLLTNNVFLKGKVILHGVSAGFLKRSRYNEKLSEDDNIYISC